MKIFLLLAFVGVVYSQCNDFAIQYQCLMNSNQRLNECTSGCNGYGCVNTRCQLECHKDAYRGLGLCITLEWFGHLRNINKSGQCVCVLCVFLLHYCSIESPPSQKTKPPSPPHHTPGWTTYYSSHQTSDGCRSTPYFTHFNVKSHCLPNAYDTRKKASCMLNANSLTWVLLTFIRSTPYRESFQHNVSNILFMKCSFMAYPLHWNRNKSKVQVVHVYHNYAELSPWKVDECLVKCG